MAHRANTLLGPLNQRASPGLGRVAPNGPSTLWPAGGSVPHRRRHGTQPPLSSLVPLANLGRPYYRVQTTPAWSACQGTTSQTRTSAALVRKTALSPGLASTIRRDSASPALDIRRRRPMLWIGLPAVVPTLTWPVRPPTAPARMPGRDFSSAARRARSRALALCPPLSRPTVGARQMIDPPCETALSPTLATVHQPCAHDAACKQRAANGTPALRLFDDPDKPRRRRFNGLPAAP
ncbi:hypothetical protein RhiJN_10456 [Ceratobasidium sp. AG-Ba]|nr:hypothetical protein RhiJN_10456 [Ceratobasidium sp. AG-Ba]QRW11185.1 hypothetical protein RhiLY_10184 [Ceratobasidium sp. AG-Ba]